MCPACHAPAVIPAGGNLADRIRFQFRVWSSCYDAAFFQRGYYGRVHRSILAAVGEPPPSAVLDVGCGTGELLRKMALRWPTAQLVGLDLSPHMLARAQSKDYGGARIELVEGTVYELPFEDASFDLVTNTISSHFYKDFPGAANELGRVLRPEGRLVMASLTNGPLRWVQRELRGLQATYRAPDRQRELLEATGLTVKRVQPIQWPSWLFVCQR